VARPLAVASAAWAVAILAAVAGVLLPSDHMRISLALFAFAVGLGLLVAVVLVADGLRHRSARRRATADAVRSPLGRLEYLPSVATRTRRIRWRGARSQVTARRARLGPTPFGAVDPAPQAQQTAEPEGELTGSAYPQPASSTRQPRIDEVEASPRAS
jgi:hypothetical protein